MRFMNEIYVSAMEGVSRFKGLDFNLQAHRRARLTDSQLCDKCAGNYETAIRTQIIDRRRVDFWIWTAGLTAIAGVLVLAIIF